MQMPDPGLVHVCDIDVELAPIREMGLGRAGRRRIIPITGGIVTGAEISGRLMNLGADWQTIFHDGVAELDARYAIETADGALIEVHNTGYRHGPAEIIARLAKGEACDPSEYYMRTTARLETGDERYAWVNRAVFVGVGARLASAVLIALYRVT